MGTQLNFDFRIQAVKVMLLLTQPTLTLNCKSAYLCCGTTEVMTKLFLSWQMRSAILR